MPTRCNVSLQCDRDVACIAKEFAMGTERLRSKILRVTVIPVRSVMAVGCRARSEGRRAGEDLVAHRRVRQILLQDLHASSAFALECSDRLTDLSLHDPLLKREHQHSSESSGKAQLTDLVAAFAHEKALDHDLLLLTFPK